MINLNNSSHIAMHLDRLSIEKTILVWKILVGIFLIRD